MDKVSLGDLLDANQIQWRGRNFEEIYSEIATDSRHTILREEIERRVFDYFAAMQLPDEPTIYDALLLSLRRKDVVATFNWDPFLVQAIRRCVKVTESLPSLFFLHGNVAHGYCETDREFRFGTTCQTCNRPLTPDPLLYPVAKKDYSAAPAIARAWTELRQCLHDALFVTIFGYGAPASDKDAVALMSQAWGDWREREFEQVEIIDIHPEDDLRETWASFIHTHHYSVCTNFWDSFLASHPRRSSEAFINQFIEARFIDNNPIQGMSSLAALHSWFGDLVKAERDAGM